MKWIPLHSSNLEAVAYDTDERVFVVQFKGGAYYRYDGVSPVVVCRVLFSESHGSALNTYVKAGGFPYTKLDPAEAIRLVEG